MHSVYRYAFLCCWWNRSILVRRLVGDPMMRPAFWGGRLYVIQGTYVRYSTVATYVPQTVMHDHDPRPAARGGEGTLRTFFCRFDRLISFWLTEEFISILMLLLPGSTTNLILQPCSVFLLWKEIRYVPLFGSVELFLPPFAYCVITSCTYLPVLVSPVLTWSLFSSFQPHLLNHHTGPEILNHS